MEVVGDVTVCFFVFSLLCHQLLFSWAGSLCAWCSVNKWLLSFSRHSIMLHCQFLYKPLMFFVSHLQFFILIPYIFRVDTKNWPCIFILPFPLLFPSPSKSQASIFRQKINNSQAFPVNYYTPSFTLEEGAAASQVVVMGQDDLIVSVMRYIRV